MLTVGIAKRMDVNGIKLTDYVLPSFFLIDVIQASSAGIVTAEIQPPKVLCCLNMTIQFLNKSESWHCFFLKSWLDNAFGLTLGEVLSVPAPGEGVLSTLA